MIDAGSVSDRAAAALPGAVKEPEFQQPKGMATRGPLIHWGKRQWLRLLLPLALLLLALSLTAAVSIGAVTIPFSQVWSIVWIKLAAMLGWPEAVSVTWSPGRESIVWDVRFPRAILAALVGAGLAVVGAILQSATRNPLADPHLLGISSGAATGAIVAMLHTGMIIGLATVPLFAFVGALIATLLVAGIAQATHSTTADRLIMAGVAVSFVLSACGNLLIFLGDPRAVHTVVFWFLGGLGLAQWNQLIYPLGILAAALVYLMLKARELNALAMGDETALTLGIPVRAFRMTLFVVTALLTGVMVAFSGAIGFVGLMIPHVARRIIGSDNRLVVPASAFLGAIALLWADIIARTIMAPEDMPIGVVTGLVGGVFFILLLRRRSALR